MSPKLKPLILPQLVEERRRLEVQKGGDGINSSSVYCATFNNSPPSDMASPTTPTFPRGHLRYSSSTSSLEMVLPVSSFDCPASPTLTLHTKQSQGKRLLPDVQEEPVEREEEDIVEPVPVDMYHSLFEEPSIRHEPDMIHSTTFMHGQYDVDYDIGFLSDNDFTTSPRYAKKRRGGSESSFSSFSFASRFGSRFPTFSAWKSRKRAASTKSPGSDASFDRPHSHSRAASSRSSSLSGVGRNAPDRSNEPPLPPTPALSFYESCESVLLPTVIDIDAANARASLERDRAMATTPLLPPLLTDSAPPAAQQPLSSAGSVHSPIMSPSSNATEQAVVRPPSSSHQSTHHQQAPLPSPPLSNKPSVSSFRPAVSAFAPTSDIPPITLLPDTTDSWSDRLGHANFTVMPKPYEPKAANLDVLRQLRADWDLARTDFTRHLARMGEHYGSTSRTYALAEEKWAEIEREWRTNHDNCVDAIVAMAGSSGGRLAWQRLEDDLPTGVPRGIGAEGKFPERGDEDIVGPMARDAVMMAHHHHHGQSRARSEDRYGRARDRQYHQHGRFWKNLVEKVERVGRKR